jgi:cyclophilin family peptidyl-prolyl cis-trans isomerase
MRGINSLGIGAALLLTGTLAACSGDGRSQPADQAQDGSAVDVPVHPDHDGMTENALYTIDTPLGRMVIRLYDETPGHRDNFRRLAAEGFYDGTTFHRVMEGFVVQGGDPNSRNGSPGTVGQGGPGYTLPAEIVDGLYHRRGAVAAARQADSVNPERHSSGSQFYIVHGTQFDEDMLAAVEEQIRQSPGRSNFRISAEAREIYMTEGGTPHLDGQYTAFGQVIEGLDIVKKLGAVQIGPGDRPVQPLALKGVRPVE